MDVILSVLKAAGETTRLRILGLLGHGELTVSELVQILRQSQPRVSRHLKLMVEAGILSRFREGTWVFYRLVDSGTHRQIVNDLLKYINGDADDFDRDLSRLETIRAERAEIAQSYFRENADKWDGIRSLYVDENVVEDALLAMAGPERKASILDVGTGTGRMIELFHGVADEALGIDLSREMLSVAQESLSAKNIDCKLRQGDMYTLPVDKASQDLVIFHQVLHFSDEPLQAIRETAKVLKDGGAVLIADFAPHDLEYLRDDHAHRRLGFGEAEVAGWAKSTGLEVEDVRHLEGDVLKVTVWRLVKTPTRGLEF